MLQTKRSLYPLLAPKGRLKLGSAIVDQDRAVNQKTCASLGAWDRIATTCTSPTAPSERPYDATECHCCGTPGSKYRASVANWRHDRRSDGRGTLASVTWATEVRRVAG